MSVSGRTLNWTATSDHLPGAARSETYDMLQQVDLRAEKTFNIDVHRFGVFMDVQNLLNSDTVTAVVTRYPNRSISGNTVAFGSPRRFSSRGRSPSAVAGRSSGWLTGQGKTERAVASATARFV